MQPFTADDYAARMDRAARDAVEHGFAGLLVTPGPDLVHLCGYAPHVTERLTLLVLVPEQPATMVVPALERPDAQRAPGAPAITFVDWRDGADPYPATAPLLHGQGRYAIADSAWAMHLLRLQRTLPAATFVSITDGLPMLR